MLLLSTVHNGEGGVTDLVPFYGGGGGGEEEEEEEGHLAFESRSVDNIIVA